MEDEKLIEGVREAKLLYDFSHPLYSDTLRKLKQWREIGKTLKQDPNKCKMRWESLRNQFRKYIRSQKTVTGQSSGSLTKWKHYENMSFLIPYMKDKTRCTSVASEDEGHAVLPDEETMNIDEEHHSEKSNVTPISSTAIQMRKAYSPEGKGHQTIESASSVLMKHLLEEEKKKRKLNIHPDKDEIDLFFDTMKATVKKFNAANKILAKKRVFSVISELEEIDLHQQPDKLVHSFSVPNNPQYSGPTSPPSASSPFSSGSSQQTVGSCLETHLETFSSENLP